MNSRIFKIIKILIIVVILISGLSVINSLFIPPVQGRQTVKSFYDYPKDKLDILFVGSSHSHHTFNPTIIYENTGLYSYNFSVHGMKFEECYYAIKEVLKYQEPKVIVIEAFSLINYFSKDEKSVRAHYLFDYMRPSMNKLEGIDYNVVENKKLEMYFPLYSYHLRWKDETFLKNAKNIVGDSLENNDFFGYYYTDIIKDPLATNPLRDIRDTEEVRDLNNNRVELLDDLVTICKENNIQLVIASAPFLSAESAGEKIMPIDNSRLLNGIRSTNKFSGIDVIDYNKLYEELNITLADFRDDGHLNALGAKKVTDHFSQCIIDNYSGIIKHEQSDLLNNQYIEKVEMFRAGYQSVKTKLSRYRKEEKLNEFVYNNDISSYINLLDNKYLAIFATKDIQDIKISQSAQEVLNDLGLKNTSFDSSLVNYVGIIKGKTAIEVNDKVNAAYHVKRYHDMGDNEKAPVKIDVRSSKQVASIKINAEEMSMDEKGINIVVYDLILKKIVSSANFTSDSESKVLQEKFYNLSQFYNLDHYKDKIELRGEGELTIVNNKVNISCTGSDCRFILPKYNDESKNIMVKVSITSSVSGIMKVLYCGKGENFSTENTKKIPILDGKNEFYIQVDYDKPIKMIRFDPVNSKGEIVIENFVIAK